MNNCDVSLCVRSAGAHISSSTMDPKSKEKATGRERESATSTLKRSESTDDTMMINNDDNTDCFTVSSVLL